MDVAFWYLLRFGYFLDDRGDGDFGSLVSVLVCCSGGEQAKDSRR